MSKFRRSASNESSGVGREVLHGTLRSELDEPSQLLPAFEALITSIGRAQADYDKGLLTRQALGERLAGLTVIGPDGGEWTLGATTGQWYRRFKGGDWTAALPPEASESGIVAPGVPAATDPAPFDAIDAFLTAPVAPASQQPASPIEAPHPEVGDHASNEPLPVVEDSDTALVDDSGVWTSSWEAAGRDTGYAPDTGQGTEVDQALSDIESADTSSDGGDTWGRGLEELFADDDMPTLDEAPSGWNRPAWASETPDTAAAGTPAGDAVAADEDGWQPSGWALPAYDPQSAAPADATDASAETWVEMPPADPDPSAERPAGPSAEEASWMQELGLPPELFEDPDPT